MDKSSKSEPIKLGIYRHYKGGEYRILGEARLTDKEAKMVVYESLRDGQLWIRPVKEFLSEVEIRRWVAHHRQRRSVVGNIRKPGGAVWL